MEVLFETDVNDYITIILKINYLNINNKTEKVKINMSKSASKNTSIYIFNQNELRWNLLFEDNFKYNRSNVSVNTLYNTTPNLTQNVDQHLEQKNSKVTEYIQNVYKILY